VAEHIAKWQNEPTPRFPLRLLFTGPTCVGKQLLASSIANTLFSGRFVRHSWGGIPGPLRLNHELRTLNPGPLVLFFKLFDWGGA
jgi:ATP-dependent Lon protease